MKVKRCPDCGQVIYRRKIAGKYYNDVHLIHPNTSMEAITMCPANKLSQMTRLS